MAVGPFIGPDRCISSAFYLMPADSSPSKNETHLLVGVITRPHGVRGELKLRLFNEESSALDQATHVVVEPERGETRLSEIESVRGNVRGLILALSDVNSREEAEAMRGAKLWVARSTLEPLEPGQYYLVDMIGCAVRLRDDVIAVVKDVRPDPSVDTMVLQMNDGSIAEVPIVDAWVGEVDVQARTVELLSEDGIIQ